MLRVYAFKKVIQLREVFNCARRFQSSWLLLKHSERSNSCVNLVALSLQLLKLAPFHLEKLERYMKAQKYLFPLIFLSALLVTVSCNSKLTSKDTPAGGGSPTTNVAPTAPSDIVTASPTPSPSVSPSPTPSVSPVASVTPTPTPSASATPSPSPSPSPTVMNPTTGSPAMDALLTIFIGKAHGAGTCGAKIVCGTEMNNFAMNGSIPNNMLKACNEPDAFITSCFVGSYPSGQQFCGSTIGAASDGRPVCRVTPCSGVPNNYWSISLTCCKPVLIPCP